MLNEIYNILSIHTGTWYSDLFILGFWIATISLVPYSFYQYMKECFIPMVKAYKAIIEENL